MKKFICSALAIMLILVNITSTWADVQKNEITDYLDCISRYELGTIESPVYGSVGGEWVIVAMARYGTITDNYISAYKSNLKKQLDSCEGVLSTKKYTEYARVTIALTAIGENPEDFGGYNLLKPLAELDHVAIQGINGIIYALIALDCGGYDVPKPDENYKGKKTTREKLIGLILEQQLEDGGWNFAGTESDADMTAMAIQALAPYYNKDDSAKDAVDRGLERLSELQQEDGGYETGNSANCESTAQVLTALSVMNIDINDSRFVKNGKTVIDGLLMYYHDGFFSHLAGGEANQMATEQAMYAMTAFYRSISGMNGLFQMQDGITKRVLTPQETSFGNVEQNENNGIGEQNSFSKENLWKYILLFAVIAVGISSVYVYKRNVSKHVEK